jgi:AAA domain
MSTGVRQTQTPLSRMSMPPMRSMIWRPTSVRLLFVGDKNQLASVEPRSVLRDLVACGRISVTLLTVIKRQGEGSPIVEAATCHRCCGTGLRTDSGRHPRVRNPTSAPREFFLESAGCGVMVEVLSTHFTVAGRSSQSIAFLRRCSGACRVTAVRERGGRKGVVNDFTRRIRHVLSGSPRRTSPARSAAGGVA